MQYRHCVVKRKFIYPSSDRCGIYSYLQIYAFFIYFLLCGNAKRVIFAHI